MVPQVMVRGAGAVYDNTLYVIGENSRSIYCYDIEKFNGDWTRVQTRCPHVNPGLVFVRGMLTAVGGSENDRSTNKLVSWKGRKWMEEIPPMPTARSSPAVVADNRHVIVIGGDDRSEVELYDMHTHVWSTVVSLPHPLKGITATLCHGDVIVAMDNTGSTYSISIDSLLPSTLARPHWRALPRPPIVMGWPTLATFHGEAVCVCSDGIHQLYEGGWVRIQDNFLLVSWNRSIVCVVRDKIVVVGGHSPYTDRPTNEVNAASEYITF